MPPFWALGWHASSNAWDTLDKAKAVADKYKEMGYPLESVWLDGNYMQEHANFMVDGTNFGGLSAFANQLKAAGQNLILTLYGGLSNDRPNKYRTLASGALIMNGTEVFEAETYSKKTVFLDWFTTMASTVWEEGLFDLARQVQFDGIQLTMNAPTLFCDGGQPNCYGPAPEPDAPLQTQRSKLNGAEAAPIDSTWYLSYGADKMGENSTYFLPFIPQRYSLDTGTIALNATHVYSATGQTFMEYDVHSLFGHMQAKATSDILNNNQSNKGDNPYADKRKFISSTSTFAGTGAYAQHHISG